MHIRLTGDSINVCVRERGDGLMTCPGCVSACYANTAGVNLGTTVDPDQEQVVNL